MNVKVKKFVSKYTGRIFNANDEVIDTFSCTEELMDYRLQLYSENITDQYVIFDFDEKQNKCQILDGGIENHPEYTSTMTEITRCVHNARINDSKNSGGVQYKSFY